MTCYDDDKWEDVHEEKGGYMVGQLLVYTRIKSMGDALVEFRANWRFLNMKDNGLK